jgi:hypothetical protein
MTDDARAAELRKLDAEIAKMRGWTQDALECGCHRGEILLRPPPGGDPLWLDDETGEPSLHGRHDPPPFSSEWALAGPLLAEIARVDRLAPRDGEARGEDDGGAAWGTPEFWARWWLAWKQGKAPGVRFVSIEADWVRGDAALRRMLGKQRAAEGKPGPKPEGDA